MKTQFRERQESKRIKTEARQKIKRDKTEQAEQFFRKGKEEQMSSHYGQAIELYMLATMFKPSYFQAFCNMGYCYRAIGNLNAAKSSYLDSLRINDQDHITRYNLANLYRVSGQNELAIKEYNAVIDLKKNGADVGQLYLNSLVNVGICYKNIGQIDQAIKANQKALQEGQDDKGAIFNLAICLLKKLQAKNRQSFENYYIEEAKQAKELVKKIVIAQPQNMLARLWLQKISKIVNPSRENMFKIIESLKEMLNSPNCNIKYDIYVEIAKYYYQLKMYDESSEYFQKSFENLPEASGKKTLPTEPCEPEISQAEGIQLIQQGKYDIFMKKVKQLKEQNLLKHKLMLMFYLKQTEKDKEYQMKAINVYHNYFRKIDQKGQFQTLSLECHKAVGKTLRLQRKFQESMKHYLYISQKIKDSRGCDIARLHNQLGSLFQQVNNRQKALQQYKKGIEIEPKDYQLTFSMGHCLYEDGNYQQSAEMLKKIIEEANNDVNLSPDKKDAYLADCMVIIALCQPKPEESFQFFTQTFKRIQKLKASKNRAFKSQEKNLLSFFITISQLYEQKIRLLTVDSLDFRPTAETLKSVYTNLLSLYNCPDRDEVLESCGDINYQLQQYASAAYLYRQVQKDRIVPFVRLAHSYAHILQPYQAMRFIQQACKREPESVTNQFCREILEWMYTDDHEGQWNKYLPSFKVDQFYDTNEYGLCILDKLSEIINSSNYDDQNQEKVFQSLVKDPHFTKSSNKLINIKSEKILQLSEKYDFISPPLSNQILSSEALKICFNKSKDIDQDINLLINELYKMPVCGRQLQFIEAALYLFIYNNNSSSQEIKEIFERLTSKETQQINIQSSDMRLKREQFPSIYPYFKTIEQAIHLFKKWGTLLETSIVDNMHIVESIYYKTNIFRSLQKDYHFPRHSNLLQNDQSFQKIYFIATSILQFNKQFNCMGSNIREMKKDLINKFKHHFDNFLRENNLQTIHLSNTFLPINIDGFYQSKEDCLLFIKQLEKEMRAQTSQIDQECDEIVIIINKIVRMRCRWYNPYQVQSKVKRIMENMLQNPFFITHQSIISLQGTISSLKDDSPEAKSYIQHDRTLNI